jgi:voltage-gated potassium channel
MSEPVVSTLRAKTFRLLESDFQQSFAAKAINIFLIVLIITNVAAAIVSSDAYYHEKYLQEFFLFEQISLGIFCIEYLLRIWCNVEAKIYKDLPTGKARLRYFFSPIALIDLIAILPFLIAMFVSIDLRSLRLLRVLRLLKLNHYFKGFDIFISVVIKELKNMTAAMMVMIFLIIIAASLMHAVEGKVQPEAFGSILSALWWSVVTMTTVGYGDVVPITAMGKVIATFIMLIGVGLVALPAGMLAARFGEELRERKKNLNVHIQDALDDGYINKKEYQSLANLAEKLDINPDEFQRSIVMLKQGHHRQNSKQEQGKCPHCGK